MSLTNKEKRSHNDKISTWTNDHFIKTILVIVHCPWKRNIRMLLQEVFIKTSLRVAMNSLQLCRKRVGYIIGAYTASIGPTSCRLWLKHTVLKDDSKKFICLDHRFFPLYDLIIRSRNYCGRDYYRRYLYILQ